MDLQGDSRPDVEAGQAAAGKTLVIILCETRAHELTYDLLRKNLLEPENCDLALCVAENAREVADNPFYRDADHVWTLKEPEDWGEAFDDIQRRAGSKANWRQLLKVKDQWLGGVRDPEEEHPGSGAILLVFRHFLKEKLVESGALEKYDRFIVTRSDFRHEIPHVPLRFLSPEFIWIPDGEDYGGYADRHIIANRADILPILGIVDDVFFSPDRLREAMSGQSNWNPERFIKFQFGRRGLVERVRRFPYSMFTVRPEGGHTRWAAGEWHEDLGYYVKYISEYRSYELCRRLLGRRMKWTRLSLLRHRYKLYSRQRKK